MVNARYFTNVVNLLLKAYAFIGIFSIHGSINQFMSFMGLGTHQILFTDFSFYLSQRI